MRSRGVATSTFRGRLWATSENRPIENPFSGSASLKVFKACEKGSTKGARALCGKRSKALLNSKLLSYSTQLNAIGSSDYKFSLLAEIQQSSLSQRRRHYGVYWFRRAQDFTNPCPAYRSRGPRSCSESRRRRMSRKPPALIATDVWIEGDGRGGSDKRVVGGLAYNRAESGRHG